jgi:outer membrane lipoprotein SlyB
MKISWLLMVTLVACASKPTLYPNDKLKSVGKEAAQKDVDQCIADAEEYLKSGKGKQIAKGAGAGAAIGAAVGVVSGLFTGDIGGSVVRSSAVGAGAGAAGGAITPDQLKQRYVNQCLADQGYRVLGWD